MVAEQPNNVAPSNPMASTALGKSAVNQYPMIRCDARPQIKSTAIAPKIQGANYSGTTSTRDAGFVARKAASS